MSKGRHTDNKPAARKRKNKKFAAKHGNMTKTDSARAKRGLPPLNLSL